MRPSIVAAAQAADVYQAALAYQALGFSVLPCRGKKPAVNWAAFQQRAASRETIQRWDDAELLENVGIICGAVSEHLVVLDLDGQAAVEQFLRHFSGYRETYRVASGSGQGLHVYFYCGELPPSTRVTGTAIGNVELRADGCYVVAPPSLHPSGKAYQVATAWEIRYEPHLRPLVEWIQALAGEQRGGSEPLPPATNSSTIVNPSGYGLAALEREAADVARALPGDRNNRLYRAALKLGSLVADGKLDEASVERELLAAARGLTETDGEAAMRKTIASGLATGRQSARSAWKGRA